MRPGTNYKDEGSCNIANQLSVVLSAGVILHSVSEEVREGGGEDEICAKKAVLITCNMSLMLVLATPLADPNSEMDLELFLSINNSGLDAMFVNDCSAC